MYLSLCLMRHLGPTTETFYMTMSSHVHFLTLPRTFNPLKPDHTLLLRPGRASVRSDLGSSVGFLFHVFI